MKGTTEDKVRDALKAIDLSGLTYFKPPDDARNWKPCDFFVWWAKGQVWNHTDPPIPVVGAAWIEVKDVQAARTFNLDKELRPSQRGGIAAATAAGVPYWIVAWWRSRKRWTISDAAAVMAAPPAAAGLEPGHGGVDYEILGSRFGAIAEQRSLASTLKLALLEELF